NASHDRALSTRFIGSAMSPSAMMAALTLPPKAMPKYFGADAAAHDARKNIVAWLASLEAIADVRGAANVPGASADEGKEIFDAYGCKSCHASGIGDFAGKNSEDFIAIYMQNPTRVRRH